MHTDLLTPTQAVIISHNLLCHSVSVTKWGASQFSYLIISANEAL